MRFDDEVKEMGTLMKNTLLSWMLLALCAGTAPMTLAAEATTTPARPGGVVGHGVEGPFFPATRPAVRPVASTGDALQAQAESRLKATFDAADTGKTGAVTKAQAQQSGLGYVANNFEKIDAHKTGTAWATLPTTSRRSTPTRPAR